MQQEKIETVSILESLNNLYQQIYPNQVDLEGIVKAIQESKFQET